MPKKMPTDNRRNLIGKRLIELRKKNNLSQRGLARQLQLAGYDIDKNVITRIETDKRSVTDIELVAFTQIFDVSLDYLIFGEDTK